jgi:hypothetical protein
MKTHPRFALPHLALLLSALALPAACPPASAASATAATTSSTTTSTAPATTAAVLQNARVKIAFDLQTGLYTISDARDGRVCIADAFAQVGSIKTTDPLSRSHTLATAADGASSLTISCTDPQKGTLLLKFSLQKDTPHIILTAGYANRTDAPVIIKTITPLSGGTLFRGKNISENLSVLDGNGGAEATFVRHTPSAYSRNNMLIHFGSSEDFHSLVMGGISYNEFNKYAEITPTPATTATTTTTTTTATIRLFATDAVGKRVDAGTIYFPERDSFFLDCITRDPFLSLETYGKVLAETQNIRLNHYYFPSICLWYAMKKQYGGTLGANDSVGAVEEMRRVRDSGWLKYTKIAVRLVPDCYDENNENGWWDDAHWQMHGGGKIQIRDGDGLKNAHYRPPYETTKKWAQAVTELGGIPLTYFQTSVRSEDYVKKFPQHMLFNDPYRPIGKVRRWDWKKINPDDPIGRTPQRAPVWDWDRLNREFASYDFTDAGFTEHLRSVYKNLKDGGVRGLMYDYPSTGWAFFGGMDDKYATTGSAYRRIFQIAKDGLGDDSYIHERNLWIGSDITLGIVASQRIWGDTDIVTPEMISRGGLRWYKNRRAVAYDMDAKNLLKSRPSNDDGLRKMLTMNYVCASRLLLANSFSALKPHHIKTLSRLFPYHSTPLAARPVDMLSRRHPAIYAFRINDDWQQVIFYNQDDKNPVELSTGLSDKSVRGGLEFSADKEYYVHDFWNNRFVGKFSGNSRLVQTLRAGEARVLSVRAVKQEPQVLATDRHLLQGYIELSDIKWNASAKELKGVADLVLGEPIKITLACNGKKVIRASAPHTTATLTQNGDLAELTLHSDAAKAAKWTVVFE